MPSSDASPCCKGKDSKLPSAAWHIGRPINVGPLGLPYERKRFWVLCLLIHSLLPGRKWAQPADGSGMEGQ